LHTTSNPQHLLLCSVSHFSFLLAAGVIPTHSQDEHHMIVATSYANTWCFEHVSKANTCALETSRYWLLLASTFSCAQGTILYQIWSICEWCPPSFPCVVQVYYWQRRMCFLS
jgi:hypothetical protein